MFEERVERERERERINNGESGLEYTIGCRRIAWNGVSSIWDKEKEQWVMLLLEFSAGTLYKHRKIFRKRGTLLRTVRKTTKWIEREEDLTIL